jgi:hypothetical protein
MNESLMRSAFGLTEFSVAEATQLLGADPKPLLSRLKQSGIVQRVGRGRYRFRTDDAAARIGQKLASMDLARERRTEADIRNLAQTAKIRWESWIESGRLRVEGRHYTWRLADAR